jgi:hypothetical protein
MAEIKLTHFLILAVVVGAVAVVVLAFAGILGIGWLNQKNLKGLVDQGANIATGYTAAKTPTEAMDKFREAILARKYKTAATYCTKPYAEQLERAHDRAVELTEEIDRIERYADNKGIKTEKLGFFLLRLDPFPKNFKTETAPVEDAKDKTKAYGAYVFEVSTLKTLPTELKDMDVTMFVNVLRPPAILGKIDLVKEGDDWKLNITPDAEFPARVANFKDKAKTYHTGLHSLADDLSRERYDTKAGLEADVLAKLRAAKQQ